MKSKQLAFVAMLAALTSAATSAADLCNVPETQRRPIEALQQKLEREGWTIKKMKTDRGCYEVYARTDRGKRVEAYFDPETFALVRQH